MEGRVVSWATGRGVANAELNYEHHGANHAIESDADGTFLFSPSESGTYRLAIVTAEGFLPFAPAWGTSPVVFVARPGARLRDVLIYLTPVVDYDGIVLDPKDNPVVAAKVRVLGDASGSVVGDRPEVTSDEHGTFRIAAPDESRLEARHPDFAPGRADVDFRVQATRRITVRMKPLPEGVDGLLTIRGTIVDPDGAPAPEAEITALGPFGPGARPSTRRDRSDLDGNFEVRGLMPGTYVVAGKYEDYIPATAGGVEAGTSDVRLKLGRGGSISGTVRAVDTGEPVPSFTVIVTGGTLHFKSGDTPISIGMRGISHGGGSTFLDANGEYRIDGVAAGDYEVRVAAFGYARSEKKKVSVTSADANVSFELSRGGHVHGRVIDEVSQEPLVGARVSREGAYGRAESPVPVVASTTTDERGEFELGGLAPGLQSLFAAAVGHHGRLISSLDVDEGGDIGPLTIALAPLVAGEDAKMELTGIGAVLKSEKDVLVLLDLLDGGGAFEAGLEAGDGILEIEGTPVSELSLNDAVNLIRGPEGSTIRLTVRKKNGDVVEIVTTRRRVRH